MKEDKKGVELTAKQYLERVLLSDAVDEIFLCMSVQRDNGW